MAVAPSGDVYFSTLERWSAGTLGGCVSPELVLKAESSTGPVCLEAGGGPDESGDGLLGMRAGPRKRFVSTAPRTVQPN